MFNLKCRQSDTIVRVLSLLTAGIIDTGGKITTGGKFTTGATSITANLGKVVRTNVADTCCKFVTCVNNAGGSFASGVVITRGAP
jgi:hypothetical protein